MMAGTCCKFGISILKYVYIISQMTNYFSDLCMCQNIGIYYFYSSVPSLLIWKMLNDEIHVFNLILFYHTHGTHLCSLLEESLSQSKIKTPASLFYVCDFSRLIIVQLGIFSKEILKRDQLWTNLMFQQKYLFFS